MGIADRFAGFLSAPAALLGRRLAMCAAVFLLLFLPMLLVISLLPDRYEAQMQIRIDPSRESLTRDYANPPSDITAEGMDTEVAAMRSLELAREVVRRLKLHNSAEFTSALDDRSARPADDAARITAVAEQLRKRLSINRDRMAYILELSFTSRSPEKAAAILNTYGQAYLDSRIEVRRREARREADWFRRRLSELGNDMRGAEQRLADYRSQSGLVAGAGKSVAEEQAAPIAMELANVQSGAAAARAELNAARLQVAQGGPQALEVRNSAVLSELRSQRAEVLQRINKLRSTAGENHPDNIVAREQLATIDAQIGDEVDRTIRTLQSQADATDAQVGRARSALVALEGRQAVHTRATATADALQREAESKRAVYERTMQLSLTSAQAATDVNPQAEIIDPAYPPRAPTAPNRLVLTLMAAVLAFICGLAAGAMVEASAMNMRSVADIESRFGISLLAAVPRVRRRNAHSGATSPADQVCANPASLFAESLRNLQQSVLRADNPSGPSVIALTSALPDEGKTTTALAFARVAAMGGAKTLLIDCDLRKASLRTQVGRIPSFDLLDILKGRASAEEVIVPDAVDGLDLILMREPVFTGSRPFAGERMARLIGQLRARYAFIILDLPPLMGVADARALAVMADATALVVRWGTSPAPAVDAALARLGRDGAHVLGAIYTMVPPNAEAIGAYHYSPKFAAYYQRDAKAA